MEKYQIKDGFSLKGRGLKLNTAEDVRNALGTIDHVENLKYLELEGNTLGVEAAKEIAKYLERRPEFECALWKDLFTGRLNAEIPKAMDYLFAGVELGGARLRRLELSDNAIGPVGVVGLLPFFKTKSSFSLKELILNNNGMGPEGGSTFAEALSQCYRLSQEASGVELFQLKVFECGRNRLENKASTRLAAFFSEIGSLEEIRMPQNGIRPEGVQELSNAFRQNPQLRAISLNDNTVRPDGAAHMAQCLREMKNLQELNLGDCLLGGEGALKIVQAVKEGSLQFHTLNLESNEIDGQSVKALANYLKSIESLRQVHLSGNEFGARVTDEFTKMLTYANNNVKVIIENEGDSDEETEEEPGNNHHEEVNVPSAPIVTSSWLSPSISGLTTVPKPFTFALPNFNSISNTTPDIIPIAATADAKIESFLEKPMIQSFRSLQANPGKQFIDYFKKKDEDFSFLCVATAIKLSNLTDTTTQYCFDQLMMEVIKSKGSNTLATILCIYYGFIRPEEKDYPIVKPTESTIYALCRFVELSPIPVLVLQCIKEFFGPTTPARSPDWYTGNSSGDLLRAIDKRLSIIPSWVLSST